MKTETLIQKLEEKQYVLPNALRWKLDDIDLRMRAIGQGSELPLMSATDKRMLLDDFFVEYEDDIVEFINQRLEDYLEAFTDYNVSEQPF